MESICNKEECTGCGACVNICPKRCIKLIEEQGFLSPNIDKQKCVDCNLCINTCPNNIVYKNNNKPPKAIAAFYNNYEGIMESTSGAIFPAIADYVIKQNGIIYGAVMNEKLEVFHTSAITKSDYEKMRGSKYIQSNTKNTYGEVKQNLDNKKMILYIGTPCQIAGLKSFLNHKDYNNLITVDLVCHGVGSRQIFDRYIKYLEEKYNSKIIDIKFRSKKNGYNKFTVQITLKNGEKKYIRSINDIYMSIYYKKGIYRKACYSCKYAKIPRIADLTIGDFAELSKESKIYKKSKNKGVSLILINNEKGEQLFKNIESKLCWEERKLEEASESNHNVGKTTKEPQYRDKILIDKEKDIKKLQIKYCKRKRYEYIAEIIGKNNIKRIKKVLRMK